MDDEADDGPEPEQPQEQTFPTPRAAAMRRGVLASKAPRNTKKPRQLGKSGSRILTKEKQRSALEMRKAGATYGAIAIALGYADHGAARKSVMRAFQDVIQEPAIELRTMQIERLNHMLLTLWPKVQQGDERAIDTSLRVMDKIDRLMGTEAAQKVDVNVNQKSAILVIDGSKEDFIRSMAQMAGLQPDGTNRALPQGADGHNAPPTGVIQGEVIGDDTYDGTDIESIPYLLDSEDEPVTLATVEAPESPVRKKFNFGVDPTITKKE